MRTLGFAYQELGPGDRTIRRGRIVSGRLTFPRHCGDIRPGAPGCAGGGEGGLLPMRYQDKDSYGRYSRYCP